MPTASVGMAPGLSSGKGDLMCVLGAIGNTPLVEITRLNPRRPAVRIFAKLEGNNPGGSVKDRPAWWMIRAAEESGQLTPGRTILEATSGNTGIALAMIGAARGYRVTLCISAGASVERRRILEALGATVVLTPACERTDGAIRKALRMLDENPGTYYMPNQFENQGNSLAHYESTGPEILAQTEGRVDVFVAGMGTSGTLMGVSRFLKERRPGVRIAGVEPPLGHRIQGLKTCASRSGPRSTIRRCSTSGSRSSTRRHSTPRGVWRSRRGSSPAYRAAPPWPRPSASQGE